jgi:hypothetical protein
MHSNHRAMTTKENGKRPIAVHARMPTALKTSLDQYSVAVQRLKGLLRRVPAKDHPPPLPALKSRHDVRSLLKRTEVLHLQCARLERFAAPVPLKVKTESPSHLAPHLRVLQEPPVGAKRTKDALEDGDKQFTPLETTMEVLSGNRYCPPPS